LFWITFWFSSDIDEAFTFDEIDVGEQGELQNFSLAQRVELPVDCISEKQSEEELLQNNYRSKHRADHKIQDHHELLCDSKHLEEEQEYCTCDSQCERALLSHHSPDHLTCHECSDSLRDLPTSLNRNTPSRKKIKFFRKALSLGSTNLEESVGADNGVSKTAGRENR